ncbi:putative repeat protein (TIGR04076 family) [Clostridium pascui]|uniref:TIGR04076 family protein n=1 Tax=Clostridium pascui TaxID=46609 RepID=UPI00195DF7DF|nr:TIGR04076 family protein [Clostridium pascui]MBM7868806.1 putative repeat protein (TIGR04076 family) [Clostridium pascui]
MKRPKIKITLIEQKGKMRCHRGHKIGEHFDFDNDRGKLCPMAMHAGFPYIDILRYGGQIPGQAKGTAVFCCPDVGTINVFKIEIDKEETM